MMNEQISKEELLNIIDELYSEFNDERIRLKMLMDDNDRRIQEIDEYVSELVKNEDIDFRIFSPRNTKTAHTDKVELLKEEKDKLIDENRKLKDKFQYYEEKVNKISTLNSVENMTFDKKREKKYQILPEMKVIVSVQEQERQRIARDLHDTSIQNIVHLGHQAELCMKYIETDQARAKLELQTMTKEVKNIVDEIRKIIFNLRLMSFDDIGFLDAFDNLINALKKKTDIAITANVKNYTDDTEDIVLLTILRIIQEAVNNAIKYSQAKNINVSILFTETTIHAIVSDDGIGFNPKSTTKGFGLIGMKERAKLNNGKLIIETARGKGTTITVQGPNIKKE